MSDTTTDVVDARPAEPASTEGSANGSTNGTAVDTTHPDAESAGRRRAGTGLNGMVLAELQQMASGLGISGTARMRKGQLIEAITAARSGGPAASGRSSAPSTPGRR